MYEVQVERRKSANVVDLFIISTFLALENAFYSDL